MSRPARHVAASAWLVAMLASGPTVNAAAESRAQEVPPRVPHVLPPRAGVDAAGALPLTLDEAVRLALEHNNDVAVARLEERAASLDLRAAEGVFDPRLLPTFGYQRVTTPVASVIGGGANGRVEETRATGGLQLAGRSPWAGGRFTLDVASNRVESTNQNLRLNPQFPATFGITFAQPLLRGRGIDPERREILLARRAADLTSVQLRRVLIEQVALLEQAYWDLAFASGNLEVQATALARARAQVESNERQVRAGTLAPIDVIEAQTQVARFEQGVATAQQDLTEAENRVKSLMIGDPASPLWSRPLVPTGLVDRPVPDRSIEQAVAEAIAARPEMEELREVAAQNEIDTRFFANQALPQVDVVANYSLAGLAGTPTTPLSNPLRGDDAALLMRLNELSARAGLDPITGSPAIVSAVPEFLVGGYGGSLSNIWNRRFPTASIQVQLDLPLGNRTASANLARAKVIAERIARQRQQAEQAIQAEVRNAAQAIRSSRQRLVSAGSARRNAQEQYDSERRRFDSGLSTVFLVLERQTALVTAQGQELRARADLNQAVVLYDRAVGATLERHHVRLK